VLYCIKRYSDGTTKIAEHPHFKRLTTTALRWKKAAPMRCLAAVAARETRFVVFHHECHSVALGFVAGFGTTFAYPIFLTVSACVIILRNVRVRLKIRLYARWFCLPVCKPTFGCGRNVSCGACILFCPGFCFCGQDVLLKRRHTEGGEA